MHDYDERGFEKTKYNGQWMKTDGVNYETVKSKIEKFQYDVIHLASVSFGEEKGKEYQQHFTNHPVQLENDCLFYIKTKEDGSYFIAVLNGRSHKLFAMEWVQ